MAISCGSHDAGIKIGVAFRAAVFLAIFVLVAGLVRNDSLCAAEKTAKSGSKSTAKSKPAAKAEADDDPKDDSDLELDEDLSALVVPAELRGTVKSMDRMKFSQELRGLLTEGMGADGEGLPAAKRHFEASHRLIPDDPRAAYAYGVALLSQKKSGEALDQFRGAAKQSKAPFLPALQAIAWLHVLKNDYAKGLPAVLDLAHKIEESKETWPTVHDRLHSAEWLGRMVGFLAGPGKPADRGGEIERLEAEIDRLLTLERKAAYEQGRKFVTARHDGMKSLLARPTAEIVAELKQKKQEMLDAARAAEAEVKQIEDDLREIKKPLARQVADLKSEIRVAAQKSKRATQEIEVAREEVELLSVPQAVPQARMIRRGRVSVPVVSARAENATEKKARETKLAAAQQRLQQSQSTLDQARQELTDLKAQIEQAQAEGRKAAAEKRPRLAEAKRLAQDLAARARDAEHGASTPEKLKERATALDNYVPLDPETEKNRLLATLKSAG
ncbi:MAG: hypothetical protein ACM3U2_17150 [Deltaproteobacteria bacterium]